MNEAFQSGLPRFTILTPCRNAENYVATAIESVQNQHYPNIEHIVVDGASTDDTLAILAGFPELRVISEPDKGAHDAMNKGRRLATGEIIGFLNTDDLYAESTLADVARAFAADPDLDVVVTGTVVSEHGTDGSRQVLVARDHMARDGFWLGELAFGAPGFNGRFFRRRLLDRIGAFDTGYFYSADRNYLIRIALARAKSRTLRRYAYIYQSHPGSFTLNPMQRNAQAFAREHVLQALRFARTASNAMERRFFLAWHAFEGAKIVAFELLSGRILAAIVSLWQLSRDNFLWPLRLPYAFACRRRMRRMEAASTSAFRNAMPR